MILAVVGERAVSMCLLASDAGFVLISGFGMPSSDIMVGHRLCLRGEDIQYSTDTGVIGLHVNTLLPTTLSMTPNIEYV